MSEIPAIEKYNDNHRPSVSLFGYELIRDILLPDLLGQNGPEILYWAGKRIARKFPLESINEVIAFFNEADWGCLTIKSEKRKEMNLELTGEIIANRLKNDKNVTFQLEAGFLAQQLEMQKKVIAESFEHPHKQAGQIQITVKWDNTDPIDDNK